MHPQGPRKLWKPFSFQALLPLSDGSNACPGLASGGPQPGSCSFAPLFSKRKPALTWSARPPEALASVWLAFADDRWPLAPPCFLLSCSSKCGCGVPGCALPLGGGSGEVLSHGLPVVVARVLGLWVWDLLGEAWLNVRCLPRSSFRPART